MVFGKIDVECAAHTTIRSYPNTPDLTLRQYDPHVVAKIPASNAEENQMFRILAKYIGVFGTPENTMEQTSTQKIAMTAPVLSTPQPTPIAMTAPVLNTGGQQDMSFVLPAAYRRAKDAPQPTDQRIELVDVPARLVAVKTFSGTITMEGATSMAVQLKQDLEEKGFKCLDWQLARYNPPFTLWFLRTNEIWYTVEDEEKKGEEEETTTSARVNMEL